ncbi:MAG: response regulator transcription factor [Nitrosomonadales bacterium]
MKILLADHHALFRDGMRYFLNELDDQVEILDAGSLQDALNVARDNPNLDLALIELHMPGSNGSSSIKLFHTCYPDIPVVVVSSTDQRDDIEKIMRSGAKGFISKVLPGQEMLNTLRSILYGSGNLPPQLLHHLGQIKQDNRIRQIKEFGLTERQIQVLQHLNTGISNKEIGMAIGMAEGTVKVHLASIYQTLRVNKRTDAVQAAQKMGLFPAHNPN